MKRWIAAILMLSMMISLFSACKKQEQEESAMAGEYVEGTESDWVENEQEEESSSESGGSANQSGSSSSQKPQNQNNADQSVSNNGGGGQSGSSGSQKGDEGNSSSSSQQGGSSQSTGSNGGNQSSSSADDKADQEAPAAKEEGLANLFSIKFKNSTLNLKGQKVLKDGMAVSGPISVQYGDRITMGPIAPRQVAVGFCYDSKGKVLDMINATCMKDEATLEGGWKIYSYAVPKNAASVQITAPQTTKDYMVLARNYTFSIKEYERLSGVKQDYFGDCLYEKNSLFVGDSICVGSGGWATRLALSTGMYAVNNGVSGSSLSTARDKLIIDQLLLDREEEFDYVLIHGGVNDAWESTEVGFVSDSFNPEDFYEDTYAGGLEKNIYTAIKYYGDTAAIGYLMNFKMPAAKPGRCADMSEYYAVAKEICEKWGITYFDMYNHKKITEELAMTTTKHTYDTKNMVHISASGYDIITPYIEEYMRTMTPCSMEILNKVK